MKNGTTDFFFNFSLLRTLQYFLLHIKFESFWEVFLEFQSLERIMIQLEFFNHDDYFMIMIVHG